MSGPGFERDMAWQSQFRDHFADIVALSRVSMHVRDASWREDTTQATDMVVMRDDGGTYGLRARRRIWLSQYAGEISITYRRPHTPRTEWHKVIEDGFCDFMAYGFDSGTPGILNPWAVINLHLLREYVRDGGYWYVGHRNHEGVDPAYFPLRRLIEHLGLVVRTEGHDDDTFSRTGFPPLPPFVDDRPLHPGTHGEPRGPDYRLAGVCAKCGSVTIRRAPDGRPRHLDCEENQ